MTEQEIFNKVAKHLLTQNEKSISSNYNCLYRNPRGLMCAIGCLISNEDYSPAMENMNVNSILKMFDGQSLNELKKINSEFLLELQYIHDSKQTKNWKEALNNFSIDNNLDSYVPD